jgi:hypothetical protein
MKTLSIAFATMLASSAASVATANTPAEQCTRDTARRALANVAASAGTRLAGEIK